MNIVKDIRQQAGLTQQQLAELAGVSTLYVIRAEQFLHPNLGTLSKALVTLLNEASKTTPEQIEDLYVAQRRTHINVTRMLFEANPEHGGWVSIAINHALVTFTAPVGLLREDRQVKHPFTMFRRFLFGTYGLPTSQIKFAALTGIHPAVLSSLENSHTTIEDGSPVAKVLTDVLLLDATQLALLQGMCDRCL